MLINEFLKGKRSAYYMAVEGTEAIFGECKWRNEPADVDILETLQESSYLHKRR